MPWQLPDKRHLQVDRPVDPQHHVEARWEAARMVEQAVQMVREAIEIDLSVIATLISLSADWYRRGNQGNGDRAKAAAFKGVEEIRRFMSKNYVSRTARESIAQRCQDLEQELGALK